MKHLAFLLAVFIINFGYAQTTAQVDRKPNRDLDIVLVPFGMEYPIKIGSLDHDGKATLIGNVDLPQVPKSEQSNYMLKMSEVLGFCDDFNNLLTQNENIDAVEAGVMFLWDNGELAGFLTLVTDTALFDWVLDPGYSKPVPGSYIELIYVETDFNFSGECNQTIDTGEDRVQTVFKLDFHFKLGLNFMEYEIQSVSRPNSEDMNSFPERVSVTSYQKLPDNVIWMAYYY